jgi:hypothetical protein
MAIHPHDKLGFRERRRLTISVLTLQIATFDRRRPTAWHAS